MSQPVWITPAGSLGVIPEGVFYQETLRAQTPAIDNQPTCTATSAVTNLITCSSTTGVVAGMNVMFSGTTFGGISEYIRYFVHEVVDSTHFSIMATEFDTAALALTNGTGSMTAEFREHVYYGVIAGSLPEGIQIADNGVIVGVPMAVASLQGVPVDVSEDVTSKFTIRAYTTSLPQRIKDRTFTLTVTGNDVPEFVTPAGSLGSFYDGDQLNIQIEYTNNDPNEEAVVRLVGGELPGGITVSSTGLISGYIQPAVNVDETPGYDLTPIYTQPYDFLVSAISKNYQFTLEVTDGKSSNLRTFQFFVYDRATMTADTTEITADNTVVTADETTERRPFIINASPTNLGTVRGDNYYAHQFIGNDYDTPDLKYAINVNEGAGLPPGLELDPNSGWYYGYIPDQGVTEVEYSFNIVTYQADFVGTPISCTATTFGTNIITCDSTEQIDTGQPIVFTGTGFGGVTASPTQVYYVLSVESDTEFTITDILGSDSAVTLTTSAGAMEANLIIASDPYPFTITISGAVNAEVIWLTDANLGTIENGDISTLVIEAENVGGRTLSYRLRSGAFNELPQGLELLPTGEISGRVSFNTFAVDLGSTTFDSNQTTWDSSFTFTVNAYAEDTEQVVYDVASVTVNDGGTGYSSVNTPVLTFSTPVGASAVQAQVGNVVVSGGFITSVEVADAGAGYSGQATLSVTEGFGGSGAVFTPVMRATGIRDVVSVYKTFSLRLIRAYNKPYQNLSIQAMPPANDRVLIASLLDNEDIFVPDYIYRPDDPYFGKATRVTYQHAFGLDPDTLETYVNSLYENHYWKNLVLGEISTAQALDDNGNILYEVVYSKIIDNLVNDAGESVAKIVNLPYTIIDPADGSTQITQVYPNSLIDMRNQVIDVVGQISTKLPLWMTSKQPNGRVLGFTPAWVICYTKPNRSDQIAYYLSTQFGQQLNKVDFKVDRYILDESLSRNWDTETQDWTPEPSLTTFDRFGSGNYPFIGYVDIATRLAYSDVNQQTLAHIAELGGLDGQINQIDGNTIIFAKQEYFDEYPDVEDAWQDFTSLYGGAYSPETFGQGFGESFTISAGYEYVCTNTYSSTNYIKASSTVGMIVNDPIWFQGDTFGGITAEQGGLTEIYYVKSIVTSACTETVSSTDAITCASTANIATNDPVWFSGTPIGGINDLNASNEIQVYYATVVDGTHFKISLEPGGSFVSLTDVTRAEVAAGSLVVGELYTIKTVGTTDWTTVGASANTVGVTFTATATGTGTGVAYEALLVNTRYFTVSNTAGGSAVTLSTASGSMTTVFGNQRMAIFTISVDPVTTLVTLTPTTQTAETQYVQIQRGNQYIGQQLYYPTSPAEGYTIVNWIQVPESNVGETTFDQGSMAFEAPLDMYDPTDQYDKYLVFPKTNILV